MKKIVMMLVVVLSLIALSVPARADVRPYVWTYGYMTPARGEIELEWWGEFQQKADRLVSIPSAEIEYGITDHWVAGLYGVGIKDGAERWKFDAIKLEQRFRLFEPGVLPVDTTLYLEYKHDFVERVNELEGKVILSKDVGKFNATLNLIVEKAVEESVTEYGYSAGVSYPVSSKVRPGVEAFGGWEGNESEHYAGPSVLVYLGKVWVNAGAGFGLTKDSDDFRVRVILSHEL
jgi:hypothetical protein